MSGAYHSNSSDLIVYTPDLFDADTPLSAYRAYWLRSNLQLLLDQSGQYRVNWVADVDDEEEVYSAPIVVSANVSYAFAMVFPVTVIEDKHPMNLDIRIAARVSGSATQANIAANLYAYTGVANNAVSRSLWAGSGVSTSTTATWVIDETFEWSDYDMSAFQGNKRFLSQDAADVSHGTGLMTLLQLNIILTGAFSGSGSANVVGIQVREYP